MTTDGEALFERLAPPPGGAAALRLRLRRDRWRRRVGPAAVAGASLALALAGLVRTAGRDRTIPREPHPALIALGLQAPPAEPATVPPDMRQRMALLRVPLATDDIVFYYVALLPGGPTRPRANDSPGDPGAPAGAATEESTGRDRPDPR